MKRSPGNISKSDPSTVPAVDLTEVRIAILIYLYVDIFLHRSQPLFYFVPQSSWLDYIFPSFDAILT